MDRRIPVLRPQLPSAEQILPYLREIDETRIYTNWGPLVDRFEHRIADYLALPGGFTSAANGTTALAAAILAAAGRATLERPFALFPAFTFIATAVAGEHCGYRPYLADVDPDTWLLDPERLAEHPKLDQLGVVVPVAPFGRPVPQAPWEGFRERTGVPVVIDGAAAFDRLAAEPDRLLGTVPVAISFHATKSFGTGEGGGVAASDARVLENVREALNFGRWSGSQEAEAASANGKLSEYHAAVGLAELDGFDHKLTALVSVADRYRDNFSAAGLSDRFFGTPDVSAAYVLFQCADASHTAAVVDGLEQAEIDYRFWYGDGLHRHPYFAGAPHDEMVVADWLVPSLIGLPLAPDLSDEAVARVAGAIAKASQPLTVS